jgi:uncharacterized protein (DUF2249 family)
MTDLLFASTEADAAAGTAIEAHHAEMSGALATAVDAVVSAAATGDTAAALTARDSLSRWCTDELLPHAGAEERTLYPAAHALDQGRLLIDGMKAEHVAITGLTSELAAAGEPVRAAAAARALQALFTSHLQKENELLLPLLTATPDVSLAGLLTGMHELVGGHPAEADHAETEHSCGCGEVEGPGYPELDARAGPHAIRHATIFGGLSSVAPGGGMVLVAPHDPLPLLAQIEQRWPGVFDVSYLERGPDAWRLAFVRRAGSSDAA